MLATHTMAGKTFRVLVADYKNSEISSEIPYLFSKAGAVVDVYCSKKSWLLKNSFWNSWIDFNAATPHEFASQLETIASEKKYDWVFLSDESAMNIVNNEVHDAKAALKLLPISDLRSRIMLGSKAGLSILCSERNLLTPVFVINHELFDLQTLQEFVTYPLLLKVDMSRGGAGVFLCNNVEEVQAKLLELTEVQKNNLVFQKYIDGETVGVEAIFKNGKLRGYACSKLLQTSGSEFNVSIEREYFECPELEQSIMDAGERLDIDGFASMTYLEDKESSKYYLVEADLRANVWFRLAEFSGVDFSRVIRNCLMGIDEIVRPHIPQEKRPLIICFFSRHTMWCLRHGKIVELLKWAFNVGGRWRFVPIYDRKLLYANARGNIRACAFLLALKIKKIFA
ncbi:MAG: hypothetical protein NT003_00035 [Candidatus Magasanikbacteria bacterium]|nr:hypothetical protein [Candidatus Magasanikbacteria bacterium]